MASLKAFKNSPIALAATGVLAACGLAAFGYVYHEREIAAGVVRFRNCMGEAPTPTRQDYCRRTVGNYYWAP